MKIPAFTVCRNVTLNLYIVVAIHTKQFTVEGRVTAKKPACSRLQESNVLRLWKMCRGWGERNQITRILFLLTVFSRRC